MKKIPTRIVHARNITENTDPKTKPYHFVGTCVNSFDDDGACIISELPWATVSDFAVAEENATPISMIDFLKNASVPENITLHNFEYMMADDVLIAYDPKKDVHYFFVKSSLRESENPVDEIKALEADLESRYPVELDMYRAYHGGNLVLSRIVAKTRNQGTGTAVMQEIVNFADKHDLTITLSPDSSLGGNKARLQSFYKRFGFKSNVGRKRDYRYSESMIRRPNRG